MKLAIVCLTALLVGGAAQAQPREPETYRLTTRHEVRGEGVCLETTLGPQWLAMIIRRQNLEPIIEIVRDARGPAVYVVSNPRLGQRVGDARFRDHATCLAFRMSVLLRLEP